MRATWQELERIETTIDEAYSELRALIAHFRLPIGEHSLTGSIEQIVERFKQDCDDVQVYLQKEWPDTKLPTQIELQVIRIIQKLSPMHVNTVGPKLYGFGCTVMRMAIISY